jgi:hypothetical protein
MINLMINFGRQTEGPEEHGVSDIVFHQSHISFGSGWTVLIPPEQSGGSVERPAS